MSNPAYEVKGDGPASPPKLEAIRDIDGQQINEAAAMVKDVAYDAHLALREFMERGIVVKFLWFTFSFRLGPKPPPTRHRAHAEEPQ